MTSHSRPYGRVTGVAYRPTSAARLSAVLTFDAAGLRLLDETGAVLATGEPTSRTRLGGGPSIVTFADGTRFETEDVDGIMRMLGANSSDHLAAWESWHPRLIVFVAAICLAAFAIWKWGLDLLAVLAIALTPHWVVETIDSSNLDAIDRIMAEPSTLSPARQSEVREIFERVASHAPPAPYGDYVLEFRAMERIGPNAFALPGGTMVITDALVTEFPDDDLIAGVLGHELAHVSEKHSLKQLYRSLSTYALISFIVGDVGPVIEDLVLEGGVLLSLSYSRAHEREADEIGVRTARAAGYDPAALAAFFTTLEAKGGPSGPAWFSTHPANEERVERIREIAGE
ncbi:M48 family metallopeptidase [Celeribacter sp.]|uniref:M48 family metallopeptidase n=1 Tax=Celeribacter sp. TaxID=1890673 RepID=UPI003A8E464A